jgi:hypothetical protein
MDISTSESYFFCRLVRQDDFFPISFIDNITQHVFYAVYEYTAIGIDTARNWFRPRTSGFMMLGSDFLVLDH